MGARNPGLCRGFSICTSRLCGTVLTDQHPTGRISDAPRCVDERVKTAYGLVVIVSLTLVAFWLVGSGADQFQIDAGSVEAPDEAYDPVKAGEPTPQGYRQLLSRDAILPVYNPTFRSVSATDWSDDTLVIGVELDGEAKAYPVQFLNRREMVIDWIAGSPILVSW